MGWSDDFGPVLFAVARGIHGCEDDFAMVVDQDVAVFVGGKTHGKDVAP